MLEWLKGLDPGVIGGLGGALGAMLGAILTAVLAYLFDLRKRKEVENEQAEVFLDYSKKILELQSKALEQIQETAQQALDLSTKEGLCKITWHAPLSGLSITQEVLIKILSSNGPRPKIVKTVTALVQAEGSYAACNTMLSQYKSLQQKALSADAGISAAYLHSHLKQLLQACEEALGKNKKAWEQCQR